MSLVTQLPEGPPRPAPGRPRNGTAGEPQDPRTQREPRNPHGPEPPDPRSPHGWHGRAGPRKPGRAGARGSQRAGRRERSITMRIPLPTSAAARRIRRPASQAPPIPLAFRRAGCGITVGRAAGCPPLTGPRPDGADMANATDHLWMHFTRHGQLLDRRGADHRARRGHVHLGRPGQAATWTGWPGCSWSTPATGAPSWPRPPRSRPASWRTSRCGRTPTRRPIELAERIASLTPRATSNRVFFTTGGGEAVETAWKLAKYYCKLHRQAHQAQGRSRRAIAYHGTSHGRPVDHRPPGDQERCSSRWSPAASGCPTPTSTGPPAERLGDSTSRRSAAWAADQHRRGDRVRGPRHGRRGLPGAGAELGRLLPAPARLLPAGARDLRRVRRAARLRRGHLRRSAASATYFGARRATATVPDIITCAKGITSGYAPLGAMIASDRLDGAVPRRRPTRSPTADTFGGHPVSAAVALANLDDLRTRRTSTSTCASQRRTPSAPPSST